MTEQELRALVRDAIARHSGAGARPTAAPSQGAAAALFVLPSGPEDSCIIEPAVMCNHCGYCKSYGH
jgi:hypothetical protein